METFPVNILAIDSITPVLSISAKGPAGSATLALAMAGQHTETMVEAMTKVLEFAGFSAEDTELVVCAEGPGSFTGLRLGWSSAKAIQLSADCPIFPVKSLLCYSQEFSSWPGAVLSVLDAKKKRFYIQISRKGTAVTDALDIDVTGIMDYLDPVERILVTGPDAFFFAEALESHFPDLDVTVLPSGTSGISKIMIEFAEKNFPMYTGLVPDHAGPLYVRKSDAENNSET
jgi:tRNA threonylcarbamoyladenosine biosynthesis protein TsaB